MELTYEKVVKWFNTYFEDVDKNQGDLETVGNLREYFTPDLEFEMYTPPASSTTTPKSRDSLLISFIHPGLHEGLTPRHYVVDLNQMIVAVQFEIRFSDGPTGRTWPPINASAHYHLVADREGGLKIRKIQYWTGPIPTDMMELWAERRRDALMAHGIDYIAEKE